MVKLTDLLKLCIPIVISFSLMTHPSTIHGDDLEASACQDPTNVPLSSERYGFDSSLNDEFIIQLSLKGLKTRDERLISNALLMAERKKAEKTVADVNYVFGLYNFYVVNNEKAIEFYEKALNGYIRLKEEGGIAKTYLAMADVYFRSSKTSRAQEMIDIAMPLLIKNNDQNGFGEAYRLMANMEYYEGNNNKALNLYNESVEYFSKSDNRLGLGNVYRLMADVYTRTGEFDTAFKFYDKSESYFTQEDDWYGEGWVAYSKGELYERLGNVPKALDSYRTADMFYSKAKYILGLGNVDKNRGDSLVELKNFDDALLHYEMALGFYLKADSTIGQANVYLRKGRVYFDMHEEQNAIENYEASLRLYRFANYVVGQGFAHLFMGDIYNIRNDFDRCLEQYSKAQGFFKLAQAYDGIIEVQASMSRLLEKQGKPEAAIFFAKQAVNTIQTLRGNIAVLGKETLKRYDETVGENYRHLSHLLISQGRLPEAEQVLELLKEQEQFQFFRRDASVSPISGKTYLTSLEAAQDEALTEAEKPLAGMLAEVTALREKKLRTPEEEERLQHLSAELDKAEIAFQQVLDRIVDTLSTTRGEKGEELKEAQALQDTLRELGEGTIALYTVVDKESYSLILITPDNRRAYMVPLKESDLNEKVMGFRAALNDKRDARPQARELLDIILPPEARQELAQAGASTLMWYLDGALRFLPLAALYDGEQYLVERYPMSIFTSASKTNLKDKVNANWTGLGLGVSKGCQVQEIKFGPLKSVPGELKAVIRQEGEAGVIPGSRYLDDDFTWQAMQELLRRKGKYPLVHIASHFHLEAGNDTMSFLLSGQGHPITLALMARQNNLFGGVDLLTLSACQTAVGGGKRSDGREVDALSFLAQRQGAKAVIATLWSVADKSTALFMAEFYRLREEKKLSKAEALRQTQIAFIHGEQTTTSVDSVSGVVALGADSGKPSKYEHPYYWAPFILMGNWR